MHGINYQKIIIIIDSTHVYKFFLFFIDNINYEL